MLRASSAINDNRTTGKCYEQCLIVNTNILTTKVWKKFYYALGFTNPMDKNFGKR